MRYLVRKAKVSTLKGMSIRELSKRHTKLTRELKKVADKRAEATWGTQKRKDLYAREYKVYREIVNTTNVLDKKREKKKKKKR